MAKYTPWLQVITANCPVSGVKDWARKLSLMLEMSETTRLFDRVHWLHY